MARSMVYIGLDGERLDFPVPKGVNRHLVARAIRSIHGGSDPDLAVRGLTDPEQAMVLEVVATLEEHRIQA